MRCRKMRALQAFLLLLLVQPLLVLSFPLIAPTGEWRPAFNCIRRAPQHSLAVLDDLLVCYKVHQDWLERSETHQRLGNLIIWTQNPELTFVHLLFQEINHLVRPPRTLRLLLTRPRPIPAQACESPTRY